MKYIELLFWICLFIVFYTYLGYGLLLCLLVKVKEMIRKPAPLPLPDDAQLPPLTLCIAAYNEAQVVDMKMQNCLALDYPADKLRILWITDGSNDRTNELLSRWPQATVAFQPERQGKTAALNRGIRFVKTELVVFTDANTLLNREALKEIVRLFGDPKVGCVAGEKRIAAKSHDNAASGGEGIYWKYESCLKRLDSRLSSTCGAAGELFALRTALYEPMSTDTLLDDFILSLRTVMRGYKIAYCSEAYATENGSASMEEEEKRKVRIAAGGLQSVYRLRALLNPLRYGIFSFQYTSHRVLRWTITPLCLFALLPLGTLLLFHPERAMLYALIWTCQCLFYLLASLGYRYAKLHIRRKAFFIPYYFLFMNANVVRGAHYLYRRRGTQSGAWEKARRA